MCAKLPSHTAKKILIYFLLLFTSTCTFFTNYSHSLSISLTCVDCDRWGVVMGNAGKSYLYIVVLFSFLISDSVYAWGKSKPHFSADIKSVHKLKCAAKDYDLTEFQNSDVRKQFQPTPKNRSFYYSYYKFENQSEIAIDIFKKFFSKKMPAFHKVCHSVKCVLERTIGNDWELYVFLYQRYKINISPYAIEGGSRWSSAQVYQLLEAIQNLPSYFFPLPFELKITKESDPSEQILYPGHLAHYQGGNRLIKLLPLWKTRSYVDQLLTITHEIAHAYADGFNLHYDQLWKDYSKWNFVPKKGEFKPKNKKNIISKYGEDDPAEDFAETFVAYRYNPEKLKKLAPKKFKYMKEMVFGGIDYTSASNCDETKSYYHLQYPEDAINFVEVDDACTLERLGFYAKRKSLTELMSCLDKNFHLIKSDFSQYDVSGRTTHETYAIDKLKNYPDIKYQLDKDSYLMDQKDVFESFHKPKPRFQYSLND
jgi:hypothetical protein